MKNSRKKIPIAGVFIATYNRAQILDESLRSIETNLGKHAIDVVVIDNGSTDNSISVAKKYSFVKYLRNNKNYFVSNALNTGFQKYYAISKYKYVILLANDVRVGPKMFDKLIDFLEANPDVGLTAPSYYELTSRKLRTMGLGISPYTSLLKNFTKVSPNMDINHFVSCYALRADLFHKLNGYNHELFPMIYEEPDLGERVIRAGYKLRPCLEAKMWHPISNRGKSKKEGGLKKKRLYNNKPKTYFFFRNRIIYMSLYSNMFQFIIFFVFFNPIIFLYYLPSIKRDFIRDAIFGIIDGTIFAISKNKGYIRLRNKQLFDL